ncbi:MAG: F0F1 ATP synthase subunit delta [Methylacidiphilales bacterium]|nr:F0F1 ATP synthase subunit delta [Candidatus Methylacidiphilales bacterium]NJR15136.1 F0F1 ATP synthase subunit delta [Calothrix sp. CSU_2_0]
MKSTVATEEIAAPYAQALMSVAKSNSLTEAFGNDARSLITLLSESEPLSSFLDNPFVQTESKKAVIKRILSDDTNASFRNFLLLLVDRKRIYLLDAICQQYLALLRELNQTVLAEVISAVPLSSEQEQAVKERVITMTNAREVELSQKVDPNLIGGVIIKVGSQVIDASLRGQLRRLSLRLTSS